MELFLAKLFGAYFVIIGAVILVRRRAVMPAVADLAKNRALLLVMSVVEIAAGLALVIAYPVVSFSLPGIISLVGYMMLIEGVIYLAAPARMVRAMIGRFNKPAWYIGGGVGAVLIGLYLASIGFGLV